MAFPLWHCHFVVKSSMLPAYLFLINNHQKKIEVFFRNWEKKMFQNKSKHFWDDLVFVTSHQKFKFQKTKNEALFVKAQHWTQYVLNAVDNFGCRLWGSIKLLQDQIVCKLLFTLCVVVLFTSCDASRTNLSVRVFYHC